MSNVVLKNSLDTRLFGADSWQPVLENFAKSCRLAVQLFDDAGCAITRVVNVQPVAQALHRGAGEDVPLRGTIEETAELARSAIGSGRPSVALDPSGLGYIAVPLQQGGRTKAVLIAGQVFLRFPDQLALDKIARERGVPDLWTAARRERPISQETLTTYGQLLSTLGEAFLDARYSELSRVRESEEKVRQRVEELEAVLAAVPAAIWIAHDPGCEVITGNQLGHKLLRLAVDQNLSLTASEGSRPSHFKVMRNGADLADSELPVQRAARGESVDGIELDVQFSDGQTITLTGSAVPLIGADGSRGAVGAFIDITARKSLERQQHLLVLELQHRTKNLLAVVQSIVKRSLRDAHSPADASATISGRLKALSVAQDFVAEVGDGGVPLGRLIEAQLDGFPGRYKLVGPDVVVHASTAQNVALVVHELTTNAIKYGALSASGGRIEIASSIDRDGSLQLDWLERDGPPVTAPTRRGFGSQLIERALSSTGFKTRLLYEPSGLRALIKLPAEAIQQRATPASPSKRANGHDPDSIFNLSVLIVEDEMLVALDAETQLTDAGARIIGTAHSLDEAKRCIAKSSFDVAVLDVNLNGQPSYPLAELLASRGVPFIFASGYRDLEGLPARWRDVPLINKPYNAIELTAAIVKARQDRSARKATRYQVS
jgi:two-component sensor histidine kinase/ligand-binding sensor protein